MTKCANYGLINVFRSAAQIDDNIMACILLSDNGSRRADAVLQLRRLSAALSVKSGYSIHPVPLQNANKIDASLLNNEAAPTFSDFLAEHLNNGAREFIVLPLFFGQSRALTSFIPQQQRQLAAKHGEFSLRIAPPLYPLPDGEPILADILHDNIIYTAQQQHITPDNVVLVEHGSPLPEVNQVRRRLAESLHPMLKTNGNTTLGQAVMQRRTGKAYDFNGELLEDWLDNQAHAGATNIIVAMLFLLPGQHAGEGGDIAQICANVMRRHSRLKTYITPLVADHTALLDVLQARLDEVMRATPTMAEH